MSRHVWKNLAFLIAIVASAAHAVKAFQTGGASLRPSSRSARLTIGLQVPVLTATTTTTTTTTTTPLMTTTPDGFDSHQMDALVQRGELEATLMQAAQQGVLGEESNSSSSSSKEKSSKQKKKKKVKSLSVAMAVRTLKQDGVVRLNGALSASTAATLREEILERRTAAYAAINSGDNWRQYFADVLLKSNRCDLLLPLKGSQGVQTALRELLLHGTLANILLSTLGEDATLYELAVLISEPGSPRQPVHPDNPHQEHPPLLTCFVALQDIDCSMGPTTFIPKTHTAAAHAEFDDVSKRDAMLEKRPSVVALLNAGDASLFDSRTMHCGGANNEKTRALFYVSFRNPRATMPIGNVGSIMPDINKPNSMTLRELRAKLGATTSDDGDNDPFDDEQEELKAVDEYRFAAAQGNADAQFNLGLCYRLGDVVKKNDAEAVRWFRLAAVQGGALAQCNLGFSYYLGEGVEKDDAEAVRWFELAAAQGLAHAQHNLGFCYSTGAGVPACDLERAAGLFQLAAEQGHPGAKQAFDAVLNDMRSSSSQD
jgi:ectoine hydroxylase-related dioxygenase (phytanoyl-CoA dioxygenase family)